jgi:Flp pilus assembly secretin CpaC
MSRFLAIAVLTVLLGAKTGFSEEKANSNLSPADQLTSPAPVNWSQKAAHLDHLRRAVEHLEAAGLNELAAKVEVHAESHVLHAELKQKRNELQKISEDIKRLERLLSGGQEAPAKAIRRQVLTRIKVLEVDLKKLRGLGLDFGDDGLGGVLFGDTAKSSDQKLKQRLLKDESVVKLLEWLQENGFSKVVAEPVLATMSGKSASFFSGGQVPVVERDGENLSVIYRNVGTQLELLPVVLGGEKIRLQIRPTLSRVVPASFTNKLNVKDYESRTFDTTIELSSGQTVAIGGLTESAGSKQSKPNLSPNARAKDSKESQSKEYIFLITAEIVKQDGSNLLPTFVEPNSVPRALPFPAKK